FDVPNYSQPEAKGVLDYYCDGSSILQQSRDKLFQKTFIATNGNPRKLYLSCWKGL
ncbi:9647_t:CDS:2, partial [Racocetra persica]